LIRLGFQRIAFGKTEKRMVPRASSAFPLKNPLEESGLSPK
jgi:hypothetical protein